MIDVTRYGILLSKTSHPFESRGILNPAVIKEDGKIHIFYRAVADDYKSSIGYCILSTSHEIEYRSDKPLIVPEYEYESEGVEDPRIVKIEDTFYMSYTAYNGVNALGALATSKDLKNWEKHGIVVPQITYHEFFEYIKNNRKVDEDYIKNMEYQVLGKITNRNSLIWDKNLLLFPRKINNLFYFLHRIKPDIQIVINVYSLDNLTHQFWHKYFREFEKHILLTPKYAHESSYIGSGCPPIETKYGWILIYHGVEKMQKGLVYSVCAALLDLENPENEIARLPYPLFSPELDWEINGEVSYVCFPTGAIVDGDNLEIYYGAADERIARASVSLSSLIRELNLNKN